MGDVLNMQDTIVRGRIDKEREDRVETIWEGIRMAKHISRQGDLLNLQSKEGIDKIKYKFLSEKIVIKADLQITMNMVKNIDQDQKLLMEYRKKEVESIIIVIINTPSLEQGSEDMDSVITPVLLLLDERMKHLEFPIGKEWLGHDTGGGKISALENKW